MDKPICFDLLHQGGRCGVSWARSSNKPGCGVTFDVRQETFDAPAIGLTKTRRASRYDFDNRGVLASAELWDHRGNHVRLERGMWQGEARFVLEKNAMALTAALLEGFGYRGDTSLTTLIPETGATLPYTLSAMNGGWRSTLGESLRLDAHGRVQNVAVAGTDFTFTRANRRFPQWDLQDIVPDHVYRPPRHIRTQDVNIPLGPDSAPPRMATIARPKGRAKPSAVAVFIGGTGVCDRHGRTSAFDIGYGQLLDDLAAEGVASVRYERFPANAVNLDEAEGRLGFSELCKDAAAVLDWLSAEPWARGLSKIVIGHSLGRLAALELSRTRDDLAAAVVLSTPGRTFRAVVQAQQGWMLGHMDTSRNTKRELRALTEQAFKLLESGKDWTPETVDARLLPLL
ncbi:MAG: hypothetical protein HQL36_02480 [Alphaproteobacteria bacterium]|nr:hypothetical protein [Alphaproteobacteria bacterium]